MLKTLLIPLRGLLAVALLLTAAPVSQAAVDSDVFDSLLKKIYRTSSDGDGDDIYSIIRKSLQEHPNQGRDLIEKLIKKLKANRRKLDSGVSITDLDIVKKRLLDYLKKHHPQSGGGISPTESPTRA